MTESQSTHGGPLFVSQKPKKDVKELWRYDLNKSIVYSQVLSE